jgi:molybdate transport system permease protein
MSEQMWPALVLSLRIALVATVVMAMVGIPLAYLMARHRFVGKSVVDALITMPLVLPPTVVGYVILVGLGANGSLGKYLNHWFGYSITFRFEGAVLAAAVVALPLLYMPAKSAFASVEREYEDIARTFGASNAQVFWHVSLPLASKGIASGLVLSFARALGEFGATMMVFGWQPKRVTLPVLVWAEYELGRMSAAAGAVVLLGAISLGLMIVYNRSVAKRD